MAAKKGAAARRKGAAPVARPKSPPAAVPEPAAPAAKPGEEVEEAAVPRPPERGMTTEQIRRIGNRIAEHEQDLKDNNTSRR
jgi:hypothetical protein